MTRRDLNILLVSYLSANTTRWPNAGSMLNQSLQQWPNINVTLCDRVAWESVSQTDRSEKSAYWLVTLYRLLWSGHTVLEAKQLRQTDLDHRAVIGRERVLDQSLPWDPGHPVSDSHRVKSNIKFLLCFPRFSLSRVNPHRSGVFINVVYCAWIKHEIRTSNTCTTEYK